jgi:hypothetical protein
MARCYARTVVNLICLFLVLTRRMNERGHSRIVALETTIESKDQQLGEINQKYARLSEDFKYNLKLIDDRDKELATFDQRFRGDVRCLSRVILTKVFF